MGFLNPKQMDEDDELPGSGLHVDLEAKVCPECRRSALPWQETCEDCGVPVVAPDAVPAREFALPHLEMDDVPAPDGDPAPEDDPDTDGSGDDGPEAHGEATDARRDG